MSHHESVIPCVPTDNFEIESWRGLVARLRLREEEIRQIAVSNGLELLGNSRWPELRLRRRSIVTVDEVRISLIPESRQEQQILWVVRNVRYPRFPLLGPRHSSSTDIAILPDDIFSEGPVLTEAVRTAVDRLGTAS